MPRTLLRPIMAPLLQPVVLNRQSIQARTLIRAWPAIDVAGTTLRDAAQYVDGTLTNGPTRVFDILGPCIEFAGGNHTPDSTEQYVAPSGAAVNTPHVTMSAWMQVLALPSVGAPGGGAIVVGFDDGYNGGGWDKALFVSPSGELYFYAYDGATKTTPAPSRTISVGEWVHVAGTADGTTLRAYINGAEVGSVACGDTYAGYSSANIFIAGGVRSYYALNARIADVRISTEALSPQALWQLWAPQTRWDLYRPSKWRTIVRAAPGGTLYTISPSGLIVPTGAIVRQPSTHDAGGMTPSGGLIRTPRKALAGGATSSGMLVRAVARTLVGAATPSGLVVKAATLHPSGATAPTGVLKRLVNKLVAGGLTPSGAQLNSATRFLALAGSLAPAGVLVRQASRSLAGALAPSGGLARRVSRVLAGALTLSGGLIRTLVSGGPTVLGLARAVISRYRTGQGRVTRE